MFFPNSSSRIYDGVSTERLICYSEREKLHTEFHSNSKNESVWVFLYQTYVFVWLVCIY